MCRNIAFLFQEPTGAAKRKKDGAPAIGKFPGCSCGDNIGRTAVHRIPAHHLPNRPPVTPTRHPPRPHPDHPPPVHPATHPPTPGQSNQQNPIQWAGANAGTWKQMQRSTPEIDTTTANTTPPTHSPTPPAIAQKCCGRMGAKQPGRKKSVLGEFSVRHL